MLRVTKRKRSAPSGLAAGERLQRDKLVGTELYSQWGWISSIAGPSEITLEHRRAACGFDDKVGKPICINKYKDPEGMTHKEPKINENEMRPNSVDGEDADDLIVVGSDSEEPQACTKKRCKDNPQCVNYVGQAILEKDDSLHSFFEANNLGPDPLIDAREPDLPVGLENLGATCYANAFIQVWFQDRAFREGVYRCKPSQLEGQNLEDSPIFQLQTTFAALQSSTQSVFNPVRLVESLHLRASEQQDAQEFSKLFMSHLATEFEKQEVPSLKTLLSDQFEGKQTYGTMCKKCGHRSERDAGFLELEVNLEHNGKLEERIEALLQSEELTDDNKYLCERCDSLQDATRYTKLRKLPPVLHISLLRFVFDISSLSRKKSKQSILFPQILDMSAFMDAPETGASGCQVPSKRTHQKLEDNDNSSGLIYELRGVLLHKGPSAYHGHYEAQVFDSTTRQFYQFNDEMVTPMASLQSQKGSFKDDSVSAAANKRRRTYSRKKARVEDSDGELEKRPDIGKGERDYISSKDAYMLIYARRNVSKDVPCGEPPEPPLSARQRVAFLNWQYDTDCETYIMRKTMFSNVFNAIRHKRKSIYSCWEITDHREESAVVSRDALLAWIMKGLEKRKDNGHAKSAVGNSSNGRKCSLDSSNSDLSSASLEMVAYERTRDGHRFDNSGIVCCHGRLDPRKTSDMKRIKQDAVAAIRAGTDSFFEPELTTKDICEDCVEELFLEKRYGLDHPKHVSQFEDICQANCDGQGVWISKRWLTDWRQARPKMHVTGKGDPPPDAPEYASHVRCVHDGLSLVSASRKRISGEACAFLQNLFPTWRPLPENAPTCETCDEEFHASKESKQEFKKQAEEEKAKLRTLFSSTIVGTDPEIIPGATHAMVPSVFLREWRAWLSRPHEKHRPGPIDNSWLLCKHDRLIIDPTVSNDFGTSISLVSLSDWEKLHELYGGGPLLKFTGAVQDGQQSEPMTSAAHDFEVCHACRTERLNNFDNATITIRILKDDEPNPTTDCLAGLSHSARDSSPPWPTTTRRARPMPMRTSNRLRQSRRHARIREVKIDKSTTVKDIKIKLHEALGIPTICQRLFFKGAELADNHATMTSLGVIANDTLYLREEKEQSDLLDSDAEPDPVVTRRDEGRAFGGTVLGGFLRKTSTPTTDEETDKRSSSPSSPVADSACPACTFINAEGRYDCAMCGSELVLIM